jgi:outer membrane receptor protein involved in Fe transport
VDYSPGSFVARQAVTTPSGPDRVYASYTPGETHYDYDVTYRQLSPYAQLELSPTPRLRLDAGLRMDMSGYAYDNNLSPLATGAHRRPASTTVSYRHLSPKLGLTFDVGGGASLFASYRHGFRAPSQNQLFQQNSADNTVGLEPVKVDSYEAGVRGQLGPRAVFQLSAYDMRITDDILTFVTAENRRVASNAGETRHRGVEGSVGLAMTPHLRLDASWSVASQRYTEWTPQAAQPASGDAAGRPEVTYSGNQLEAAPRDLGNVLLTYTAPVLRGGRVAVEWSHTGRYAMDPGNTHFYGGYELLNAYLDVDVPRYGVELFARGVNLLGRDYAELASWDAFQRTQLTPGAPRALYAGVKYAWSR